ncbi:hypothetical protein MSKU3_3284 [Komagataeibacter oboediens]|nr:hypothetical protein MSKU3_3284 [Komagataeibacter oboediens]
MSGHTPDPSRRSPCSIPWLFTLWTLSTMRLLSESDLKRVEYDVGFREVPADRSASGKRRIADSLLNKMEQEGGFAAVSSMPAIGKA